jgi:cytochrome c551/c552
LRKLLKWTVIVLAVLFLGIQLMRPVRSNPPVDESQTIEARTQMTPQVKAIFERSCNDCHSNKTVWPWYTNVAPISWWIVGHINQARQLMNLSEWGKLDRDRQDRKLRQICDEVTDGGMPLPSYLPMHPKAKLSEQDKKTLCDWTAAERERLSGAAK